jgi:hypothetical protein
MKARQGDAVVERVQPKLRERCLPTLTPNALAQSHEVDAQRSYMPGQCSQPYIQSDHTCNVEAGVAGAQPMRGGRGGCPPTLISNFSAEQRDSACPERSRRDAQPPAHATNAGGGT